MMKCRSYASPARVLCLLLLACLTLPSVAQAQAPVSAETVLEKWASALGGRDRLRAVRTTYIRSAIETGGLKGSAEIWAGSSGSHKETIDLGNVLHETTVFDGTRGWERNTNGKVRELAGADLEQNVTDAYLASYSQFLPERRRGQVEYAGEEAGAWILRIKPEGGRASTYYIDQKTGLPVKETRAVTERTQTTFFSNWREAEGVKFPGTIRQTVGGDPKYDVIATLTEARVNVPLDAATFNKPQSSGPDFQFAAPSGQITVPFDTVNGHIYISGHINGSRPLSFIFDTGAEATIINADRLSSLGLQATGTIEGRGNGERSVDVALVNNARIEFPQLTLAPRPLASISLSGLEPYEGRAIDGILGYDIISSFAVVIDYAAKQLTLMDPAKFTPPDGSKPVPMVFVGNTPQVNATITLPGQPPIEGAFLVDTGARQGVALNAPFVQKHNLLTSLKTVAGLGGAGIGGRTANRTGRLQSFTIGDFMLTSPLASFSTDTKGGGANPDQAGTIGARVLQRFTVAFDYGRQRMYLKPNASFATAFDRYTSGLLVVANGSDFRQFTVRDVLAESPAAVAGLLPGDRIVAVNGRPAEQFTMSQIDELLESRDAAVTLEVERQGMRAKFSFKPRKLI